MKTTTPRHMIIKCPNPVKKRTSSKLAEKGKQILLIEEHKAFATYNILTYDLLLFNYSLICSLTLASLLSCPVLISSVIGNLITSASHAFHISFAWAKSKIDTFNNLITFCLFVNIMIDWLVCLYKNCLFNPLVTRL